MRMLLYALFLAAGAGASDAMESVTGNGAPADEARTISGVSRVTIQGGGEVTIERGDHESLSIRAESNVLPYLTAHVESGTLILGQKAQTTVITHSAIIYRLTLLRLEAIQSSGSARVSGTGLAGESLSVLISGSGDVALSGRCDHQIIDLSGSGSFAGADLVGSEATVRISGSGDAVIHVDDKLTGAISGSGSIRYLGTPKVTPRVSGSGRIVPMERSERK